MYIIKIINSFLWVSSDDIAFKSFQWFQWLYLLNFNDSNCNTSSIHLNVPYTKIIQIRVLREVDVTQTHWLKMVNIWELGNLLKLCNVMSTTNGISFKINAMITDGNRAFFCSEEVISIEFECINSLWLFFTKQAMKQWGIGYDYWYSSDGIEQLKRSGNGIFGRCHLS